MTMANTIKSGMERYISKFIGQTTFNLSEHEDGPNEFETLKAAGMCIPDDIWSEPEYPHESENISNATGEINSTVWKGQGIWASLEILRILQEEGKKYLLNVVSHRSTVELIETVTEGRADFAPIEVGINLLRLTKFDFSLPVRFSETVIISRKCSVSQNDIPYNFLPGAFYERKVAIINWTILILLLLLMWMSSFLSFNRQKAVPGCLQGFSATLCHCIGAFFAQGFPSNMRGFSQATRWMGACCCVVYLIITTIWCSLVTEMMINRCLNKNPHSTSYLSEDSTVRIIIHKNTYVEDLFCGHEVNGTIYGGIYRNLTDRVDVEHQMTNSKHQGVHLARRIIDGTHVLIDDKANFMRFLRELNRDGTIFALNHFQFSDVIDATPAGWIYPKLTKNPQKNWKELHKALSLRESLNLNLQWLVDLGIYGTYSKSLESGLFEQNSGLSIRQDVSRHELGSCSSRPIDRRRRNQLLTFGPTGKRINKTLPHNDHHERQTLGIINLRRIFNVFMVGQLLSVLIFILEVIWNRLMICNPRYRLSKIYYKWKHPKQSGQKRSLKLIINDKVINPIHVIRQFRSERSKIYLVNR